MPIRDDHRIAFLQEGNEAVAIIGEHMESCLPTHWLIVCEVSVGNVIRLPPEKSGLRQVHRMRSVPRHGTGRREKIS